jgi:hypothetical protein
MSENVDMRRLLSSVGSNSFERALLTPQGKRTKPDFPSVMMEKNSKEILGEPLLVSGFLDGIQASICLRYIEHRPVYLSYAAAGVITEEKNLNSVKESLELVMSSMEKDWYESIDYSMKQFFIEEEEPEEIELQAANRLSEQRNLLESNSIEENLNSREGYLVLDGGLVGKKIDQRLVGVVKTTRNKYLEDESQLRELPEGYMSPRFIIPAGSQGVQAARYATYVRLHDASKRHWNFGLIRLESFDPEVLEKLAMRCLLERQSSRSMDARFDRHITSIKSCEEKLRANRPSIFQF